MARAVTRLSISARWRSGCRVWSRSRKQQTPQQHAPAERAPTKQRDPFDATEASRNRRDHLYQNDCDADEHADGGGHHAAVLVGAPGKSDEREAGCAPPHRAHCGADLADRNEHCVAEERRRASRDRDERDGQGWCPERRVYRAYSEWHEATPAEGVEQSRRRNEVAVEDFEER